MQYNFWIGFEFEKFKSFYCYLEKTQSNYILCHCIGPLTWSWNANTTLNYDKVNILCPAGPSVESKISGLPLCSLGTVAVTLAWPLHVSKIGQSKEKRKTKQATLIGDFHAHGSKSSFWPIRLARSLHRWRHNPSFPRFEDQSHTEAGLNNRIVPLQNTWSFKR